MATLELHVNISCIMFRGRLAWLWKDQWQVKWHYRKKLKVLQKLIKINLFSVVPKSSIRKNFPTKEMTEGEALSNVRRRVTCSNNLNLLLHPKPMAQIQHPVECISNSERKKFPYRQSVHISYKNYTLWTFSRMEERRITSIPVTSMSAMMELKLVKPSRCAIIDMRNYTLNIHCVV